MNVEQLSWIFTKSLYSHFNDNGHWLLQSVPDKLLASYKVLTSWIASRHRFPSHCNQNCNKITSEISFPKCISTKYFLNTWQPWLPCTWWFRWAVCEFMKSSIFWGPRGPLIKHLDVRGSVRLFHANSSFSKYFPSFPSPFFSSPATKCFLNSVTSFSKFPFQSRRPSSSLFLCIHSWNIISSDTGTSFCQNNPWHKWPLIMTRNEVDKTSFYHYRLSDAK